MAGMGPAPKHPSQRRRRNASIAMTRLPAEGRRGRAPKWPIVLVEGKTAEATRRLRRLEKHLWGQLWALPQAVAWEQFGYLREVAIYVRWSVQAELGDLNAAKEARQLADRLGLYPLAMLRLRWEVAGDEIGEARAERETPRRRLRALDPASA